MKAKLEGADLTLANLERVNLDGMGCDKSDRSDRSPRTSYLWSLMSLLSQVKLT